MKSVWLVALTIPLACGSPSLAGDSKRAPTQSIWASYARDDASAPTPTPASKPTSAIPFTPVNTGPVTPGAVIGAPVSGGTLPPPPLAAPVNLAPLQAPPPPVVGVAAVPGGALAAPGQGPAPGCAGPGCGVGHGEGCGSRWACLARLGAWATYRPNCTPACSCNWCYDYHPYPPLYTYFFCPGSCRECQHPLGCVGGACGKKAGCGGRSCGPVPATGPCPGGVCSGPVASAGQVGRPLGVLPGQSPVVASIPEPLRAPTSTPVSAPVPARIQSPVTAPAPAPVAPKVLGMPHPLSYYYRGLE